MGNPGQQYESTRHNAGFWLADRFAEANQCELFGKTKFTAQLGQTEYDGDSWLILKPLTFMNRSGRAVQQVCQYFNVEPGCVLVAHDEVDFEPGVMRFKSGGGHGGHNGLRDIIAQLGTAGFSRLRIGVGRSSDMINHVLKPPGKQHRIDIDNAIARTIPLLSKLMGEQSQRAIQELHSD